MVDNGAWSLRPCKTQETRNYGGQGGSSGHKREGAPVGLTTGIIMGPKCWSRWMMSESALEDGSQMLNRSEAWSSLA